MRLRALVTGLALSALWVTGALAEDLCPSLTRLLSEPPSGFVAGRVAPAHDQIWTATPVVARATCEVWEARAGDADTLSCTINDRAAPAEVTAFYDGNVNAIDQCLAGLPQVQPWQRTAAKVAINGLRGAETVWVHDTDKLRFKISLADYRRTATNSSYNSFAVEFLKY